MDCCFVYITTQNKQEAQSIGTQLIKSRLAACCNVLEGMESMYWWQGEIKQDQEVILIAKTTQARFEALKKTVLELHSYDVPCIVAMPIVGGSEEYLRWIEKETQQPTQST